MVFHFLDYFVFRNIALRCSVTWKRVKITGRVLMFRGLGRRIWKWRANRRLAKLVNAYIKTISERKESYKKQLNKLQELLESGVGKGLYTEARGGEDATSFYTRRKQTSGRCGYSIMRASFLQSSPSWFSPQSFRLRL